MDIYRIIFSIISVLPYQLIEAFPGVYFFRSLEEEMQERIFMGRQGEFRAVYRDFTGFRIKRYVLI